MKGHFSRRLTSFVPVVIAMGGMLGCSSNNSVDGSSTVPGDEDAGFDAPDVVQANPDANGPGDGSTPKDGAAPDGSVPADAQVEAATPCTPGTLSKDCPKGLGCVDGFCAPCAASKQCSGQLCVAGTCTECTTADDCKSAYGAYFVCQNGTCLNTACADDVECMPFSQVCKNYGCKDCVTSFECVQSSAYGSGYQCLAGKCSTGTCTGHANCPKDAPICGTNNQCRGCQTPQECLDKNGVTSGFVCDTQTGLCVQGDCYPDKSACGTPANQICENLKCRSCTGKADCAAVFGTGMLCLEGHCLPGECESDQDCSAGQKICDLPTHTCRNCVLGSDECGAGRVCGEDGVCHTGQCYPPGEECCDADGLLRVSTHQCGTTPTKTEYRCTSPLCGGTAQRLEYHRFCDGLSGKCTDSNVKPLAWQDLSTCGPSQICEAKLDGAGCSNCAHGCSGSACYANCTPGTACCNPDGTSKSSECCFGGVPAGTDVPCAVVPNSAEYQCSGQCGGQVQKREKNYLCDGQGTCGQSTNYGQWTPVQTCTGGFCNSATAQCDACPNGCGCVINNKCYGSGERRSNTPDNCHVCNAATPNNWTAATCPVVPQSGTNAACSDTPACNASTGKCPYSYAPGNCIIGGNCIPDGQHLKWKGDPGWCYQCDANNSSWSLHTCSTGATQPGTSIFISGTSSASTVGKLDCNAGDMVTGLAGNYSVTYGVTAIRLECERFSDGYKYNVPSSGLVGALPAATPNFTLSCPALSYAVGLQAYTGAGVIGVALTCGTIRQIELYETSGYTPTAFGGGTTSTFKQGTCDQGAVLGGVEIRYYANVLTNRRITNIFGNCYQDAFECCYGGSEDPPWPIGKIQAANNSYIEGWACSEIKPDPISVHLYFDGGAGVSSKVIGVQANLPSDPSVYKLCYGGTAHKFHLDLTPAVKQQLGLTPGQHSVYAYAIDPFNKHNPEITSSPMSFNVQ